MSGSTPFWTAPNEGYGAVHRADSKASNYNPDVLLVLVHGILGSRFGTWGTLAQDILSQSRVDVDVLSYEYPSKAWQRASFISAARDLRTLLKTSFGDFRNYLFIAHSTGGLVVKQMLRDDCADTWTKLKNPEQSLQGTRSLVLRTRRIINVTVPHVGGRKATICLGRSFYRAVYPFFWPIAKAARTVSGGKLDWGYNAIVDELRWHNPQLVRLEHIYARQMRLMDANDLPRPISIDVIASGDLAIEPFRAVDRKLAKGVPLGVRSDRDRVELRGTHGSVKAPRQDERSVIAALVAEHLSPFRHVENVAIARATVGRAFNLDRDVEMLVGAKATSRTGGRATPDLSLPFAMGSSQHEALQRLATAARRNSADVRRIILTGDAGVGKSVVLRRLARRLAVEALASDGTATMPIIIPLQQMELNLSEIAQFCGENSTSATPWELLGVKWCERLGELLSLDATSAGLPGAGARDPAPTFAWLDRLLRTSAVTLIFDGVDEFVTNHDGVTMSDMHALAVSLQQRYQANTRLVIVFGVRSSQPRAESLATSRGNVYEVRRLTEEEALSLFPAAAQVFARLQSDRVRRLLLAPLVLSKLGPRLEGVTDQALNSRSGIMQAALEAIVERMLRKHGGKPLEMAMCVLALSLVAWRVFVNGRAEIAVSDLRSELAFDKARWEQHLQSTGRLESSLVPQTYRLLEDAAILRELLTRTVFFPSGQDMYRFRHREWEDYLVSVYFVQIIRWRFAEELGHRAFHHHMFVATGEQVTDLDTSEDGIAEVLETARRLKNFFIAGNLVSMLAASIAPLSGPTASQHLFSQLDAFTPVIGFAILSGLSARVLLRDPRDEWADQLRPIVLEALSRCAANDGIHPLTKSLAWCFLTAFAQRGFCPPPVKPWPGLWSEPAQLEEAASLVSSKTNGHFTSDARQRSLQVAFLKIQRYVLEIAEREISAVHYLYPVAAARSLGAEIDREAFHGLVETVSDPKINDVYQRYTAVPEVSEIWYKCVDLVKADGR